jgi:capsular polysaccharide biosynthesis protein
MEPGLSLGFRSTARERSTMAARSVCFEDFRVLVVVLVAVAVTFASLTRTPTYEASAQVRVDQQQEDKQINPLPTPGQRQDLILTMTYAIDSRPVAEEAIQRLELEMTPAELLDNLTIEQVESTSFIVLSYEDTNPERAKQIANTVGKVSSEHTSERSSTFFRATVWKKAE